MKVVRATRGDVPLIIEFIRALAKFEKLENEVVVTPELLERELFDLSGAEVVFLEDAGVKVAFALYFMNFSTFLGRRGIYLEDLFVLPEHRGRGYGQALLAHLAKLAVERGCGRLEWSVLDWNEDAIRFYKRLGARAMEDWTVHRLTGQDLKKLAESSKLAL